MNNGLTELEKELLESVFAQNLTDEGGKLYIHQEEALRQLRGAMAYLEDKYPGKEIVYRMFDPLTKLTEKGLLICSPAGSEKTYRTVILPDGSGYCYSDTLYSEYVHEKYDAQLSGFLSAFIHPVRTETVFSSPAGREVNGDLTAEELIAHEPVLIRHTDILSSDRFDDPEQLISVLKGNRYFGSYSFFHTDESGGQLNFNVFEGVYSEGENA